MRMLHGIIGPEQNGFRSWRRILDDRSERGRRKAGTALGRSGKRMSVKRAVAKDKKENNESVKQVVVEDVNWGFSGSE